MHTQQDTLTALLGLTTTQVLDGSVEYQLDHVTICMQVQGLQQQVSSLSEELQESTKQVQASQEHAQALEDELQHERQEHDACAQQLEGLQAALPPQVRLASWQVSRASLQQLGRHHELLNGSSGT